MYINMNHLLQIIKVFLAKIIIIYKICFSKERILEELKNYFQIFENVQIILLQIVKYEFLFYKLSKEINKTCKFIS